MEIQNTEYRQLLIHSIHQCAIKFSEVAASVVDLLMYVYLGLILPYLAPKPRRKTPWEKRLLFDPRTCFRFQSSDFKKQS